MDFVIIYYMNKNNIKIIDDLKNGLIKFKDLSIDLQNNKSFLLVLVKKNGHFLNYFSSIFKDDKDIVLTAINNNYFSLQHASNRLKNDKDIILQVVKKNGRMLEHLSKELNNNKEIVMEAVKQNASSLMFASEELQNDKELIEILNKKEITYYNHEIHNWYQERMEVLNNFNEKELMKNSILFSKIKSKKNKF